MFKFNKTINTKKADPVEEMKSAISDAIDLALKNGVQPFGIIRDLESRIDGLRRQQNLIEERRRHGMPMQYEATEAGIVKRDPYREMARAEEARTAKQLREEQEEYQAALQRRSEA
jgi:hypothetical protein